MFISLIGGVDHSEAMWTERAETETGLERKIKDHSKR